VTEDQKRGRKWVETPTVPVELEPRKAIWAGAEAVTQAIASQQPGAFAVQDCGKDWWSAPQSSTRAPAEYEGDTVVSCRYRLGDRHFLVRVSLEEIDPFRPYQEKP
jgi:hypothetical protein